MAKLQKMGVKFVEGVDKSGFIKDAEPIQDKLAAQLGPGAVKVLTLVRDGEDSRSVIPMKPGPTGFLHERSTVSPGLRRDDVPKQQ